MQVDDAVGRPGCGRPLPIPNRVSSDPRIPESRIRLVKEPAELDIGAPNLMADAYDTYADLRAKGPFSRVRFAGGAEEASEDSVEQRDATGRRLTSLTRFLSGAASP